MNFNFTTIFLDFYHTRFFVITCIAVFTFVLSLRMDHSIKCSYWIVFIPLWFWKLMSTIGFIVGLVSWCCNKQHRHDRDNYLQFKGMIISYLTNIILFIFELLTCENMEESNLLWILCFIPLLMLSLVSIITFIWLIRHERTYEMELIISINLLEFIFIALKLDNLITWSWAIVFIPIWIVMCLVLIGLCYLIVITIIVTRNNNTVITIQNNLNRGNKVTTCIACSLFVLSILVFEILLVVKLDNQLNKVFISYFIVSIPLYFAYLCVMFLSFNCKTGNIWWFGIKRDFCEIFLILCPCMRVYGNVQFKICNDNQNNTSTPLTTNNNNNNNNDNEIVTTTTITNNNRSQVDSDLHNCESSRALKSFNKKYKISYLNELKNHAIQKPIAETLTLDAPD